MNAVAKTSPDANNPFDSNVTIPPFAGRDAELTRIHHHVTNPINADIPFFVGWQQTGKTSLLKHYASVADDTIATLYVPLKAQRIRNENHWLKHLYQRIEDLVVAMGFSASRLPERVEGISWREWLKFNALPEIYTIIRPQRRIVILLDDIEELLQAMDNGVLPKDHLEFLHSLDRSQLAFVITATLEIESRFTDLQSLIENSQPIRLGTLDLSAIQEIIQPASSYTLSEKAIEAIANSSGGHPAAVQQFGYYLYQAAMTNTPESVEITPEIVKKTAPKVFHKLETLYRQQWERLSLNEQLTLLGIANLIYTNPTHPIRSSDLEKWLISNDFQLDLTGINVALRSLDYEGLIQFRNQGLHITSRLLLTWVLDQAKLNTKSTHDNLHPQNQERLILIASMLAVAVVLAIILASGFQEPAINDAIIPTVTIAVST